MIVWKLDEVMFDKGKERGRKVTNRELARHLGVTDAAISILRSRNIMPRLTPVLLAGLCEFFDCQPGDLLAFDPSAKS